MASISRLSRISSIKCRLFHNTLTSQTSCFVTRLKKNNCMNVPSSKLQQSLQARCLQTTPITCDLMEFFDTDKENLGKDTVKCGRPWSMDELRIKSNTDLHKLWYILLKERNMLMTMEHEYREQCEVFPSPERIHKVEESMENILEVIKERNVAYNELETGETGLPGQHEDIDALGRPIIRHHREYPFPAFMNIVNRRKALLGRWTIPYLRRWRERVNNKRYATYMRKLQHAQKLKEEFPNADIEFPEEPTYMKEFEAYESGASFEERKGHRM